MTCGLKREARLITGRDWRGPQPIVGGGNSARIVAELAARARAATLLVSSGIAGGLAPGLNPGDLVIDGPPALAHRAARILCPTGESVRGATRVGQILGQDAMAESTGHKDALFRASGALAVDMESHLVQQAAERAGQPWLCLRVIADTADDDLPPAARVGMAPDGGTAIGPVLWSLVRAPGQLPALLRTARQAGIAFTALESLWRKLSPDIQARISEPVDDAT